MDAQNHTVGLLWIWHVSRYSLPFHFFPVIPIGTSQISNNKKKTFLNGENIILTPQMEAQGLKGRSSRRNQFDHNFFKSVTFAVCGISFRTGNNSASGQGSALAYIMINLDKIHWTLQVLVFAYSKVSVEQVSPQRLTSSTLVGKCLPSRLLLLFILMSVCVFVSVYVRLWYMFTCTQTHTHGYINDTDMQTTF